MNNSRNDKNIPDTDHINSFSENEAKLRLIIDNIPSLVAYVDASRKYRLINRAYQNFFGISEADFIGKHVREEVGPEIYEFLKSKINTVPTGGITGYENRYDDKNGMVHQLSTNLIPYIDLSGY